MLVRKKANTFKATGLPFRMQDNTVGTLDIDFKKLTQEKIDELFDYDSTRVSEIFDEVVAGVSGYADEGEEGGKPVLMAAEAQLTEARTDPAIVSQTVEHFFTRMRRVRPGEKTSKRWA